MLLLALMLAGVSVWLEWRLVHANRVVAWFFHSRNRAIVGSVFLSVAVGSVFGAGGLICLVAGLGSTFIIQPLYAAEQAGLIEAGHKRVDSGKSFVVDHADDFRRRAHQVKTISSVIFAIIAAPFKAMFWILDRIGVQ